MTYFKIISGSVASDSHLWNQVKGVDERMAGLHLQRGKEQIAIKTAHAGDIAVVSKLNATVTGDSLCEKNHPLTIPAPQYPAALLSGGCCPEDPGRCRQDFDRSDPPVRRRYDPFMAQRSLHPPNHFARDGRPAHRRRRSPRPGQIPGWYPDRRAEVPYREGITRKASAQYRHKKQSGGSGQFGEVHLRIEPMPGSDFEFTDELVGMNLSKSYLPPIEKGIRAALEQGVYAGYPLSNVKVIVYDGKEHPVDSKPIAFETAGREAFKLAVHDAGPVLFEPIMNVRVIVPDANMGDVMGDMNSRRGRVQGTESERGQTIVNAHVPLAEMLRYTTELRSMTGGRGYFTMEFDHYDVVPTHLAQPIIEAHKKEMEAKKEE
jgi:elongation factor G